MEGNSTTIDSSLGFLDLITSVTQIFKGSTLKPEVKTQSDATYLEEKVDNIYNALFEVLIDFFKKNTYLINDSWIAYIFHKIIVIAIDYKEVKDELSKLNFSDILTTFLNVVLKLKNEEFERLSILHYPPIFSERTFQFVESNLASDKLNIGWLNVEILKDYFEKIPKTDSTKSLRFQIRSLILVVHRKKNLMTRLSGLKD